MGLFRHKPKSKLDAFGALPPFAGALPASAPAPASPATPPPAAAAPSGLATAGVIDARGVPGLREEVMQLAMSGGSADQILGALQGHGIALPGMVAGVGAVPNDLPLTSEDEPATRLRRLQALRRDALITEDEYEAQRAHILAGL